LTAVKTLILQIILFIAWKLLYMLKINDPLQRELGEFLTKK